MSSPIAEYIRELSTRLGGSRLHRRRALAEVGQHLDDVAAELERDGVERQVAEQSAVERFGDVETTAALLTAPRRGRRLVLAVGLGVAVVAAAGLWLSGSGGAANPPRALAAVTPWIPVSQKAFNPFWSGVGSPHSPPCRQADLRAGSIGAQGATGELRGAVKVVNRSDHTCLLSGGPSLRLLDERGRTIPVDQYDDQPANLEGAPRWPGFPAVPLMAHHTASAYFAMSNVCDRRVITGVQLRWLGGSLFVPANSVNGQFRGYCIAEGQPGGLYVQHFQPEPAPSWAAGVDPAPLTASISAPERVSAGDRLDYLVTLTNPTPKTYRFGACPTYWQGLNTQTRALATLTRVLVLNCKPTPTIGPHGHAVYRMQFVVPRSTPPGVRRLLWLVDPLVPSKPVAARIVVVR